MAVIPTKSPEHSIAMDVLESREASLRFKLLGSALSPSPPSTLIDRLCNLQTQLDQLTAAVSGSAKLRELCTCHAVPVILSEKGSYRLCCRPGDF